MNGPAVLVDNDKHIAPEKLQGVKKIASQIKNLPLPELQKEKGLFVFPPKGEDKGGGEIFEDKDECFLKECNGHFETGNAVGFIGLENERLIVRSRFEERHGFFFQYMLSKVLGFSGFDFSSSLGQEEILPLLSLLFPFFLKRAVSKGIYKEHMESSYNDFNPRGSFDFPRHIKENTPFAGKAAYKMQEMSLDNKVTELVRETIEHLASGPMKLVLKTCRKEVRAIREATPSWNRWKKKSLISCNKIRPVLHGYFQDYRPLQKLCLAILENRGVSWGRGSDEINGIIFDCAWLWEEYVNTLIEKDFQHPRNGIREGKEYLFYHKRTGYHMGPIYPDFISKGLPTVIADAKYKPLDLGKEERIGDDLRRMGLYLWRFQSNEGCFIYPKTSREEEDEFTLFWSQGGVRTVGIKIPQDCEDWKGFREEMENNEEPIKKGEFLGMLER